MKIRERLASIIDRAIEIVSPTTALERSAARKATEEFSNAFQGARYNRISNNWEVTSGSADYDLLPDLPTLRERSRELLRNDCHAASVVSSLVDNTVGPTGIRPQSAIRAEILGVSEEEAAEIRRACEVAWERWVDHADISRRENFYEIQRMVLRSIVVNGESIILPVRKDRISSPYSFALEVIEPDRLEYPGNLDSVAGRFNRRSGVELGKYGNPVAYWIRTNGHPGDGIYERPANNKHRRIQALDSEGNPQILHIMNSTRPGQTRGEPMLAPCLQTFKDLASFTEAVLVRERVSACFSMFIQRDDPYNAAVNRSDETVNSQRIQEIEPGMVSYLAPGENVTFGNPGPSSAGYDSFVMRHLRSIGAALGLPYELVAKDFSQTNYSSARAALLESRRVFGRWQNTLINHLCKPTYSMVIEEAWLRGEIPVRDFERLKSEITRSRWVPPSYGWVDPKKEVEAAQLAIDAGLSSLAIEAAAQGRDWEQVLEQKAREEARRKELFDADPESGDES